MGNYCTTCIGAGKEVDLPLPPEVARPLRIVPVGETEPELIVPLDKKNPMAKSYILNSGKAQKVVYNWHSIPLTSVIDCVSPSYLKIKNNGIKDNNFLVGIIKKDAFQEIVPTPWKQGHVICYESHQNERESGIIFNGQVIDGCGRGLKTGETLTMSIQEQTIEFKIQEELLGKIQIPKAFLQTPILPYVSLFHEGDKVVFWGDFPNKQHNQDSTN